MRSPYQKLVRGFTLLELLIVITIISIIIGLAALSTSLIGNVPLEREAQRLQTLVDEVSKEAIIRSRVIGIRFGNEDYQFLQLVSFKWQPMPDDSPYKPRAMPENIRIEHNFEPPEDESENLKPMSYFLPTGEVMPFEVTLRDNDNREAFTLTIKQDGSTEMVRSDE